MKKATIIWMLIYAIAASDVVGDELIRTGALSCASLENDIARLNCYDQAYGAYRTAFTAAGEWKIGTTIDPLDDSIKTLMVIESDGPAATRSFFSEHFHKFVIKCHNKTLSAWITWDHQNHIEDPTVTYRIGDDPAQTEVWHKSVAGRATFYPGDALLFIEKLIQANTLAARIKSNSGEKITAIFNMNGLQDVVEPIRSRCLSDGLEEFTPAERSLIRRSIQ